MKVDSGALGATLRKAILRGQVDLTDPVTTVDLLRRESIVGVKGIFDGSDNLISVGIQCALCHTTVDDSTGHGAAARWLGEP